MYKALLKLTYTIHEIKNNKLMNHNISGEYQKLIEGNSEEDCIRMIEKLAKNALLIKKGEYGIRRNKTDNS